eukprot:m.116461 g.116461  ORF g.116461 m.116461 type:complete len:1324 (+) comp10922_c1_seq1:228-4199(+)
MMAPRETLSWAVGVTALASMWSAAQASPLTADHVLQTGAVSDRAMGIARRGSAFTAAPTAAPTLEPTFAPTASPTSGSPTQQPTPAPVACADSPINWEDSFGASCGDYVGFDWCNASGTGPQWQPYWGPIIVYSVNGISALDACCGCGGGEFLTTTASPTQAPTDTSSPTTSPTAAPTAPGPQCDNSPSFWKDSFGASCGQYLGSQWCNPDGSTGPGWAVWWGAITDYAVGNYSALDACCACGGGAIRTTTASATGVTRTTTTTTVATTTDPRLSDSTTADLTTVTTLGTQTYTTITPGTVCQDSIAGWADSYGATCQRYANENWCLPSGTTGPAWQSYWGTIEEYSTTYNGQLTSAYDACCVCGGGEHVRLTTTGMPLSTTMPTTTEAVSLWECIHNSCIQQPVVPVCANGVQFMNDCWARCFGVNQFTDCSDVQDAPGSSQSTTVATTQHPGPFCCPLETASFGQQSWLSHSTCGVDHVVRMECGAQKTGNALRVCSAEGAWSPEDPSDCVDTVIADLFRRIDSMTNDTTEVVLTQVVQRLQFAPSALGETDIRSIILFMSRAIELNPAMPRSLATLLTELYAGLTRIRRDLISRVHSSLDTEDHLLEITDRFLDAVAADLGDSFEISSIDGRVVIMSDVYNPSARVRRSNHTAHTAGVAEFRVWPPNASPRWIRVPLSPFDDSNIANPVIRFAYFETDNFAGRSSSAPSGLESGAPVFALYLDSWPSTQPYPRKISFSLPVPPTDNADWECGTWTPAMAWQLPECSAEHEQGSSLECGCFSGEGVYGLAPQESVASTVNPLGSNLENLQTDEAPNAVAALFGAAIVVHAITIAGFFIIAPMRAHGRRFVSVNLIAAVLLAEICVVIGFDQSAARCKVAGVFVQYFAMVSCIWAVMNTQILYHTHMLQPITSTFVGDCVRVAAGWGLPAVLAAIGGGASDDSDWVQDGMCWPKQALYWSAFAWPCLLAVVIIAFLLTATVRAPQVGVAETHAAHMLHVLHKNWERPSGAAPTAVFVMMHAFVWAVIPLSAYGGGDTAMILAAVMAVAQSLYMASHNFIQRKDSREACAAMVACTEPVKPALVEGEDPEDFLAHVAQLTSEKVLAHLFEGEESAKAIAQLAVATARSELSNESDYPHKVILMSPEGERRDTQGTLHSEPAQMEDVLELMEQAQRGNNRRRSSYSSYHSFNDEYMDIVERRPSLAILDNDANNSPDFGEFAIDLEWEVESLYTSHEGPTTTTPAKGAEGEATATPVAAAAAAAATAPAANGNNDTMVVAEGIPSSATEQPVREEVPSVEPAKLNADGTKVKPSGAYRSWESYV